MKKDRMRIVLLGYIIRGPLGGLAWHHLQYAMCLASLGHEVYFFEDSGDYPACFNPATAAMDTDPSYGLEFAKNAFGDVGLADIWAYYDAHTSRWHGPLAPRAAELAKSADVVMNLSAVNPLRAWCEKTPVRVFVDTDPAFIQIRHLTDTDAKALAEQHTHFFTFAENIHARGCAIPDDGLPWRATRQPVALEAWPVTPGLVDAHFTTVMQWDSYKTRQWEGRSYGMKSASFPPFFDLPQSTTATLEMAVGSAAAPRDELRRRGWTITNPMTVTRNIWTYQDYIVRSAAEFSVAKHGYVASNSGWFSERSAAYLASGRPVVTQDTGFSSWLPTGKGLLRFATPEEALEGIEDVRGRYAEHCRAARDIAEEFFDGRKVLTRMLGQLT